MYENKHKKDATLFQYTKLTGQLIFEITNVKVNQQISRSSTAPNTTKSIGCEVRYTTADCFNFRMYIRYKRDPCYQVLSSVRGQKHPEVLVYD